MTFKRVLDGYSAWRSIDTYSVWQSTDTYSVWQSTNTDIERVRTATFSYALITVVLAMPLSQRTASGQSADTSYRIVPQHSPAELRALAAVSNPPAEAGPFRESDLVDLATLDAPLQFDIRYATENNFMGMAFYRSARAFLQRPAAKALEGAAQVLADSGYGLIVFDGYRPWFVTKMFWDATPDSLKHFVAPPQNGSRHNRGAAVDVGLYDLRSGEPVSMPSGYDEFTERAYADFAGGSEASRRHRDILRGVMQDHGFEIYPYEWWHFDYRDWQEYPIMNHSFEEVE